MKDFARGWRTAPSRYLEYLYGVRPLADELNNAVQVLTELGENGCLYNMTLVGKWRTGGAGKAIQVNSTAYNCVGRYDPYIDQRHRASLNFSVPQELIGSVTPLSPFSQFYETTSMTFVLDWVLPIGSWLRGFEGLVLRPFFREGSVTLFMRRTGSSIQIIPNGSLTASGVVPPIRHREFYMSRVALTSFPTELVMQLPRFRSTLGLDKLDQASALAGQRMANLGRQIARYY